MLLNAISYRRGDNPYEVDDGYQDVSASVAAQELQAEAGPVAEADYAQVDMSKKKRNRRPVTDEYAQVDKSKKSKKPRKVHYVRYYLSLLGALRDKVCNRVLQILMETNQLATFKRGQGV